MTKKYILTGGPGSGKSSTLLELEARGEFIIREAAEDVIKRYQAHGVQRPWELYDFQGKILYLQIQREARIPENVDIAFIDRGIPDGLAYAEVGTAIYKEIQQRTKPYDGIFLIENLGQTETNEVRRESQVEALKLERKIYKVYKDLGYQVQIIPPASVKERAHTILEYIKHDAMTQPETETRRGT